MIKYQPNPIFEAYSFLSRRAGGSSISAYVNKSMSVYPSILEEYDFIAENVARIEERLESRVPAERAVVEKLYSSLSVNTRRHEPVSLQNIASLFFIGNSAFEYSDANAFFAHIRANIDKLPIAVMNMSGESESMGDKNHEPIELVRIINESFFTQKSKLMLIDAVLSPSAYIDMIEATLTPIAEEFAECYDLWEPLVDVYRDSYSGYSDANSVLSDIVRTNVGDSKCVMCPVITAPGSCTTADAPGADNRIHAFIGFMYELFIREGSRTVNAEAEMSRVFNILSDKKRLIILKRLTEGPVYGREIVDMLNLTPGAVSYQLGVLISAGLVNASTNGNRTYYTFNNAKMQEIINALQGMFPDNKTL